jgi:hypothetical protein
MLKIGYQAAWFMAHRIRFAMGPNNVNVAKLNGTVEVDETYVGGKGELRTKAIRKTPVVALIERGGNMRTEVVNSVNLPSFLSISLGGSSGLPPGLPPGPGQLRLRRRARLHRPG